MLQHKDTTTLAPAPISATFGRNPQYIQKPPLSASPPHTTDPRYWQNADPVVQYLTADLCLLTPYHQLPGGPLAPTSILPSLPLLYV